MAATKSKTSLPADSDVHITKEDQNRINKFARHNAKLDDLKDELKAKQKEFVNLEDAINEMLLLDDCGDDGDTAVVVPIQLGEVFFDHSTDQASTALDKAKETLEGEISSIKSSMDGVRVTMNELKVQLYAKFGKNINLEAEDD